MSQEQGRQPIETEDEGELTALILRAAQALVFAGQGAKATVRFAIDDQWFSASLTMIDESEVPK